MKWTVALDPGDQAALDFATRGQPETLAVSPSGVVAASKYGPMSVAELEQFLAAATELRMIRRWGPWIGLAVVVAIALGGRALAERRPVARSACP